MCGMRRYALFLFPLFLTFAPSIARAQAVSFSRTTFSNLVTPSAEDLHADLNNDGREDFITQSCGGAVVTLSSGASSYDSGTCYKPTSGVSISFAIGDFNGDGRLDLMLNSEGGSCPGCLYEFINIGGGTLQLQKTINVGAAVQYLTTGDVNHDSRIDVLFTTGDAQGNISLHVWFGDGHSGFTAGPSSAITLQHAIIPVIGDFDGDGKADVLVEGVSQVNNQVLYGDGAGHFQAGPIIQDNIHHAPYDLNGDGKMDLVAAHDKFVRVNYGNANRTFAVREIPLALCAAGQPVVADFNGDGINDIAISEEAQCQPAFSQNTLNVLLGNPDGSYQPEQVIYTSDDHFLEPMGVYRINQDRKPDIGVETLTMGHAADGQVLFTNTTIPFNSPTCAPPNRALGFNLCSPTSTVSASNSVRFSIGAGNQTPGRKVEVWIDGKKAAENLKGFSHYSFLDATLKLAPGTHRVGIFTAGWDNLLQEYQWTGGGGSTFPLTVSSSTCPTDVGLVVCSPLNDTTLTSPVRAWSVGKLNGTTILRMEVWVDGVKRFSTFGSNTLDTTLNVSPGIHQFAYYLIGRNGSKTLEKVNATVR